jgi:hypothetical protein
MAATGCAPTGLDLYSRARDVNMTMKEEIAAFQLYVFDGEWDAAEYGDIPQPCGANGYKFFFRRTTPLDDGWWMPQESTEAKMAAMMKWLEEHGWSEIRSRTYSDGVTSTSIEAKKSSGHVDDLLISFSPGEANDIVSVRVTGSCEPGDQAELRHLMFPDGLNGRDWSGPEHPASEPKFGLATPAPTPSPEP